MWEIMNGMTDGLRSRFAPRRRNGVGTMTAMLIGASVGIAAWEAVRRNQMTGSHPMNDDAARIAEQVMESIQD